MKKGFTLVELVTVLVILAIIALIVTPKILVSVKDYKQQVYDTNLNSIKSAAMSWATDHINDTHFPSDESASLLVSIEELIINSYLTENITDAVNGGTFDDEDHNTYVIIDCINIKDEITSEIKNTKYSYAVYISDDDFLEQKALEYASDNSLTTNKDITSGELKNNKYIKSTIYNTDWYTLEKGKDKKDIRSDITISIVYNGNQYKAVVK